MKNQPQITNKRGFTLIELLVVIAIIGILSAIGLVSLNGAREKARDAQRMSDLSQYRTALALYADSNRDLYPGATGDIGFNDCASSQNPGGYLYQFSPSGFVISNQPIPSNIFLQGATATTNPLIPRHIGASLRPPLGASTPPTFQQLYCYDTNGGVDAVGTNVRNGFLLYTQLESGDKNWYWIDNRGRSDRPAVASSHNQANCNAGVVCAW